MQMSMSQDTEDFRLPVKLDIRMLAITVLQTVDFFLSSTITRVFQLVHVSIASECDVLLESTAAASPSAADSKGVVAISFALLRYLSHGYTAL